MPDTFEQWARSEIARHRTEADALQRALDKFLESNGYKSPSATQNLNGAAKSRKPKFAPKIARKGSKRNFVLMRIGESLGGATTDELWNAVSRVHPDMKRSSLRALLYLEAKSGNIEKRGQRYVLKQDRPDAATSGLSS